MTDYLVGIGHDQALTPSNALVPQPRSTGIQVSRRNYAVDGSITEDGLYIILEYTALESADQYQDVLDQFDLMDHDSANVTVYVRDSRWQWKRYNAKAIYPQQGSDVSWESFFPRDIRILVHSLEELS